MKAADNPFFLATALQWYKRPAVQEAIAEACAHREVAARYGEGFGRRPEQIIYPADVLSFAMKKATSFHCSEERWRAVSQVKTGASRKEQDALRTGWDLVLDIDCPHWFYAKLTAKLFIEALRRHGVTGISIKFSGNKGFHIGVPFEAFPSRFSGRETKELFPEAPRAIATYLLNYIASTPDLITIRKNTFIFNNEYHISFEELTAETGRPSDDFISQRCRRCGARREESSAKPLFLCTSCGYTKRQDYADYLPCERCKESGKRGIMEPQITAKSEACRVCGVSDFEPRFAVEALIEVDTVLLASRHLFRAPYSLHEKSGLVSVVFDPEEVMVFEKEQAAPNNVSSFPRFLTLGAPGEATELLAQALSYAEQTKPSAPKEFAVPEEAIPEELFPPCMRTIFQGLPDGRKRAMFALTNFLRTAGWGHEQITARLEEWNKVNPEPLREVTLKSHLRSMKQKREAIPPPNCKSFYQDIGVCKPDDFCARVRNPAQYARRQFLARQSKRAKLTEEQKKARRTHREKQRKKAQKDGS
ncbi:hypothetical protein D6789_01740 [Candidatus Woesearchaeota archaeon]|nr:MAG: hypothetical protein D6789_01740 [Candidatus Woesearchaeota archaeon]